MKKKAALGLAGIAAVAVIGGTWAYWSQDLTATNEFETGKFDSDIVEQFTPPAVGEWLPGVTTEKDVKVTNSGDVDMALVAEITQEWNREGESLSLRFAAPDPSPITRGYENAAVINWGKDTAMHDITAMDTVAGKAKDMGITATVSSLEDSEAKDKWVLVDVSDDYSKLTFVYNGIVPAGEETPELLNSVTLNSKIESYVSEKNYSYDENGELQVETNGWMEENYEDAQYTMDIHVNTVQATGDAIREIFSQYEGVDVDEFLSANADDIADAYLEATSSNAN
ncbi:camelysin metallo-endopeptidase [Clostridium sp. CAG:149]|nr:camelysin metallo-endopeptidase [Clostridium sp. CAG:149]